LREPAPHRHHLPVLLQDADLADGRVSLVRLLDIVGLNVLAPFGHDHGGHAPGQAQEAATVDPAKVARAEPPVRGKRLPGLVGEISIAGEDVRPADDHLALGAAAARGKDVL